MLRVKNSKGQMVDANALQDLDVERIDGVDRPATGRKFLLMKSADAVKSRLKVAASGVRKSVSFASVVFGSQETAVTKSVREWVPGEGEQTPTKVASSLNDWAGRTEDATKTPEHRATSGFDKPGPTHGAVRVGDGYLIKDPWLYGDVATDPGFSKGEESGIVKPGDFRATNPAPLPNDGDVVQLSKSEAAWAYADAKSAGDHREAEAIARVCKQNGYDVRKDVDGVEFIHGPVSRIRRA